MSPEASEFLPLFLEEASGRLNTIFDALDDGAVNTPEELETLLREAHTLKGSSSIVGLGEIEQIAHAMEDLLSDAHESGSALDEDACETVRRLAGAIRRRLDDLVATAGDSKPGTPAPMRIQAEGVRVPPEKIDRLLDLVGETVLQQRRVLSAVDGEIDHELASNLELTEQMLEELQDRALQIRILPISTIVRPLRRAVRQLADTQGKFAELVVEGVDAELDRTLLEGLADSLTHIVRNAVAHGIESPDERRAAGKPARGSVRLSAVQRERGIEVTVQDDGRGVAPELLAQASGGRALAELLAEPGMSTAAEVTELSGRGVGMDAVRRYVGALGGDVSVESTPGAGTQIRLRLPQTLTLLDVLLIGRGSSLFGLPLSSVREVGAHGGQALCGETRLALDGAGTLPYRDLADILSLDAPALHERPPAVIVDDDERSIAVACDRLVGQEQVVIKSLALPGISADGYIGAAILGDGQIALILDPHFLTQSRRATARPRAVAAEEKTLAPKALVVEDSFTVRELQRSILEAAGYRVTTARDGADALRRLDAETDVSIVITDLEMPELDGFGLIESVRADERRSSLPIVIVSSLEDEDARRRAGVAGADAFVVKRAYDQTALLETVEQLVGR